MPNLDVKRIKMRFRIVNGSNSSNFNLKLDNRDNFYQIASNGGFFKVLLIREIYFLTPGETEVWEIINTSSMMH